MDVVRVLAAVLLLGNIEFEEISNDIQVLETQHSLKKEINAVANLLGVSSTALFKGFTIMTYSGPKGQVMKKYRGKHSVSVNY